MRFFPYIVDSKQKDLVRYLVVSGVISGLMCACRILVTLFRMEYMYYIDIANSAFAILALGSISLWCVRYLLFRLKDLNHVKDYKVMKWVSLFAALCCFLRAGTAAVYFLMKMDGSVFNYVYVSSGILLWVALGLFFMESWYDKRAKEKRRADLKAREQNAGSPANH